MGYRAIWFLYKGEPWDIARVYRPDGAFTGYYTDILAPVQWQGADPDTIAPITDLFLDLWISPDGRNQVLDEDEFEEALAAGFISRDQGSEARQTLSRLRTQADGGLFPPPAVREFDQ